MFFRKLAGLASALGAGMLMFIHLAYGQNLPLKGPGLGNLTYSDQELFKEVSRIGWNEGSYQNGIPAYRYDGGDLFGNNVGIMLNGYFLTEFAPDSGPGPGGFLLYDVSDPRDIKLVKTIYEPDEGGRTREFREPHAFGVSTINGRDYVALQSTQGVEFWDFTDINNIQQVKKVTLPGVNGGDYNDVAWQLWWQAPYLYVAAAEKGLFIVDARDPPNARLADRGNGRPNPVPISAMGGFDIGPVFAMGNQLTVTSMESVGGFSNLDISDPLNPVLIDTKQTLPKFYATCFNGRKLYTSGRDGDGNVAGYNLSDPRKYTVENENTPVNEGLYCTSQDNYLIVGAQRHIFKFDVTNPAGYVLVGESERAPNNTNGPEGVNSDPDLGQVAMFGNLVFVGSDHGTNTAFRPHQTARDTTPPAIVAQSPANAAQQQALTSRIGFGFSDSILPETANADTFIVRKRGGAQISGTYSVQLGLVNFSPAEPLQANTEYEVVLPANGLKDYMGNGITQQIISTFSTGVQSTDVSYVHRWPLADSLADVAGGNDGVETGEDNYAEGGLDLRNRSTGVQLEGDSTAAVLGNSATVSFRVKTTQIGANEPWLAPGVFGRDHIDGDNDVFWGWIDAQGHLNLSVGDSAQGNPGTRSQAPINDGQFHNIAMTRDAETGAQALYVDGVKATSNSAAGVRGLGSPLQMLGQIQGNPVPFKGILADVRIYPRVLGDNQIARIFNLDQQALPQQNINQSVSIDPASLGLNGETYIWNFGDGSPLVTTTSGSPVVNYTYQKPGNYTVSVTVIANNGAQTQHSFIQTIINPVTSTAPVHTSNIVGDGTFAYAVDPDAGTVAAIDARNLTKTWQLAVGSEPKTLALDASGRLWVTVQGEDKFLKIDPITRSMTSYSLAYGSAPYGVVFTPDGNKGLLTLAGKSALAVFNPVTGTISNTVNLPGGDVRGIAVSADSRTAYVTRFRSLMSQAELYKVDLVNMTVSTIALPVDQTTTTTEASAPGVANYLNQAVISPDGLRVVLPSKKDNVVQGQFRTGEKLKTDSTVRSILSNVDVSADGEVFGEQIDFNNRAPARAALFSPSGNFIFVAQMESNSVAIVDSYRRTVLGSVAAVGRTPHGLYLDAAGKRLFVNNFLDRSVTVHDISKVLSGVDFVTPAPTTIITVEAEPLAANVLAGKRIFYNAGDRRMSKESYISCASCHVDGDSDGMVWDFTQRGEGLRRTISLQGRQGVGPANGRLHWTGNFDELQDFEKDIRDEFGGLGFLSPSDHQETIDPLGPPKAGRSGDLDSLAAYVSSLRTFPRSPHRGADGCLTSEAVSGKQIFEAGQCTTCHGDGASQDNLRHDVGTIQGSSGTGSGQPLAGVGFDTPTLYGIWDVSSFFHNGSAATLADVFAPNLSPQHGGQVAPGDVAGLVAYLKSLDAGSTCPQQ